MMGKSASTRLLNLALYQVGWFACVGGAALGHPYAGAGLALALTALHVGLACDRHAEIRLILAAGLAGAVVESVQLALGVLIFEGHPADAWLPPLWILVLWLQFATLFRFALSWLADRWGLAALLGLVGGPLAFFAGERIGAAMIAEPRWQSLGVLGLVWAAVVPAFVAFADAGSLPGRYRPIEGPVPTGGSR